MPYKVVRRCLGPEGNGVSPGEGGEGGLGPPDKKRESSLAPARKEQHGAGGRRKEEPGVTARTKRV